MSQSPETAPAALPYIYKNPFAGSDLVEGDTFGHGEDLTPRPGLVVEGRSDDIFETIPNEGIVRSETVDDIDITDNRTPEMGVEDGLFSAEANEISDADQAGRLARMGSFVTSKFVELKTSAQESISKGVKKHPKLVAGMAAFAIIGGAAEQATGETNPVNQKASTSALTGNTLKQACVSQGLEIPQLIHARMHNPGRKHNPRIQAIDVKVRYDALPEECNGEYRRLSHMTARLQNPLKPKRWYKAELGLNWREMFSYDATTNTGGNKAGTSGANITSNGHEGDNVFYKCSPGKRKTRARLVLRNQVKDLDTGKIVGQKFKKHPIKIDGGGC